MVYSEDQINQKIKQLPLTIQKVILSNDFINDIQEIGADHDLYIWQIGALEQECKLTILGLHTTSDFIANLKKSLDIDEKKAEELQKKVNEKIFIPVRKSLVTKTDFEDESSLTKEDILNEIENPTPRSTPKVQQPTKISANTSSETSESISTWDHPPIIISSKLLDDKLSEIVKLPPQHTDIIIDVDEMERAKQAHLQQKLEIEKEKERKAAFKLQPQKSVDGIKQKTFGFSKKDMPPLRVRKNYEADPYRESVE